ncbi:type VI secretion system tip protein VgrG [Paraburkholderia sp. CNPSo 3272]|uniref:type VI secretion system Vgr family protein n=1 Tax=Paraburkholderia sp. CNPSo 3272 TaxID=2940931 RepID=UPI0020B77329|nr:type VI secretion system Vgr family protein [Paraburkholderia sp. CNPSo 3272]MCP3723466.1 type VI secretion system tip protein VgrG [Paraburkholderia sp. CNPSo 3272]
MNAVTKSFTDALRHPSARLSQRLRVWVGILEHDFDVVKFRVRGGFCKDYTADVTVTSSQLDLDGKEYVGRRAGLQIDERVAVPSVSYVEPVDHEAATFNGVITRIERIGVSRDEATYRLRIEPRFAALCKRIIKSDTFKDVTLQEMIRQALVDRKNFDAFDVEFQIEGLLEKMEQVVMYEESLWTFITRHCRRKGVFWFYKQGRGKSGQLDTIVFANNPRAYIRSVEIPLIADSGLSAGCHEAVLSLNDARTLVPATIELYERNYRTPDDPLRATVNVCSEAGDRSVFGQFSRSAEFHLTQQQGEALTQTRRDEQIARQVTLSGTTNALGVAPGVVVKTTNVKVARAQYGFVITSMVMKGSRTLPAHTRFKAMPAHLTYRPRFHFERDWRFLKGPVVGVVTTFDSSPYGCMDEHGRYPVLPKFLQGAGNTDRQLLKLRLVRVSSSDQGGLHAPLLPGTEVLLDAAHADVDRMHITGALHDYAHRDPVRGTDALYSYAIWRSPLLGAEVVFNDLQGKESARIATVNSQSAFNQGYLLNSRKLSRGNGFEATTQGWGAVRAAKGLFFTADAAAGTDTPHLEMPAAVAQLKAALQRVTDLAAATTQAGGDPADRATQSALLDGLNQLRDAGLLASAPGGMAFVTPKSLQHSAGESVIVTAGKDLDVSIAKRLRMAVGDMISLCAHKLGVNLTAAKGKFTASALTDGMDLFAKQQVRVASESADIQLAAKTKIALNSGGGSLVIENGNMTFHCPGAFTIKAGSFTFVGPDNVPAQLPILLKSSLKISDTYSSSH